MRPPMQPVGNDHDRLCGRDVSVPHRYELLRATRRIRQPQHGHRMRRSRLQPHGLWPVRSEVPIGRDVQRRDVRVSRRTHGVRDILRGSPDVHDELRSVRERMPRGARVPSGYVRLSRHGHDVQRRLRQHRHGQPQLRQMRGGVRRRAGRAHLHRRRVSMLRRDGDRVRWAVSGSRNRS